MPKHDDNFDDEEDLGPSKSELKRRMTALQALGEALTALPDKQLAKVPIEDERLRAAITETRLIKSNSARRRHMQYIGKLMRLIDAEPIAEYLQRRADGHQEKAREFQALEALRDSLINGPDSGIEDCMVRFPDAERSRLRQLVRTARKERDAQQSPKAARKLFKYLRELAEQ